MRVVLSCDAVTTRVPSVLKAAEAGRIFDTALFTRHIGAVRRRLGGQLLFRLRQKDGKDHECDEPLDRKAHESGRVSKLLNDQS
jgi:hypothetical protein